MRIPLLFVLAATSIAPSVFAGENPAKRLNDAANVLADMMQMSDKGIPQDLMDKAQCVVVVPGLKKLALGIGGKYGKGFIVCRKESGAGWSAPAAISVEGGSVGFQIGGSEQDVIMLVRSKTGEEKLLQDKFTVGGEATASAGPVGRDASAQTDAQMHAEILSYSRSRGLFAGISLEGATLRPDKEANASLYGHEMGTKEVISSGVAAPASARRLETLLNRNSTHKMS